MTSGYFVEGAYKIMELRTLSYFLVVVWGRSTLGAANILHLT